MSDSDAHDGSDMLAMAESLDRTGRLIAEAFAEQSRVTSELADEKRGMRRQFLIVLAVVAATALLVTVILTIGQRQEANAASERATAAAEQAAKIEAQAQCRARISNAAAALRDARDTITSEALVAYATTGRPTGLVERARRVDELNRQLKAASDMRTDASDACATNPDTQPPTTAPG